MVSKINVTKEEVLDIREMLTRDAIVEVRNPSSLDSSHKGHLVLVIPFDTVVRAIAKIKAVAIEEYELDRINDG